MVRELSHHICWNEKRKLSPFSHSESIRLLENKLQDSNAALTELFKNKERLEQNIKVKKNSLLIEQQKCMTLRKHFPFVVVAAMKDPPLL